MRKFILLIFVVLMTSMSTKSFCNYIGLDTAGIYIPPSDEVVDSMINAIPMKDGQILFDHILEFPGKSADDLYIGARKWFVDKFKNPKYVFQINDKEDHLLTGKGTHSYGTGRTFKGQYGYLSFTINLKTKDGKLRYQIYDLEFNGIRSNFWGTVPVNHLSPEKMLIDYKGPKTFDAAKNYLRTLVVFEDYLHQSIIYNLKKSNDISDF